MNCVRLVSKVTLLQRIKFETVSFHHVYFSSAPETKQRIMVSIFALYSRDHKFES